MTNLFLIIAAFLAFSACGPSDGNKEAASAEPSPISETLIPSADSIRPDSATFYSEVVNKKNCFIVIAKHPEYRQALTKMCSTASLNWLRL